MNIKLTPRQRRELANLPLTARVLLGEAGVRVRAALAALDRNLGRILGVGTVGLLVALLVIGQVNHMTRTDTDSAAGARPSTSATAAVAPAPPVPAASPTRSPAAAPASGGSATHEVAAGDTLAGIALRHHVGYRQIAEANGIADPNRITPGQRLAIPPATPGTVLVAPGDTLGGHAERAGLTVSQLRALNPRVHDPDRIMAGDQLRVRP